MRFHEIMMKIKTIFYLCLPLYDYPGKRWPWSARKGQKSWTPESTEVSDQKYEFLFSFSHFLWRFLLMFGIVFWKVHYLFCIFNRIHTEVFISEGPVKSVSESMKADIRIMTHCVLFVTGAPIKDLSTEKYWGETWLPSWLHTLWCLNQGSSLTWVMQWWWQWRWRWWR